ncbi:stage II sporulation protein R [Anaerotaenia torta]|uniref:stage II sporulation protein R n=1 Tax=Anaerotaenia torta TaxID=433293 RepID=UPI003D227C86
MKKKLFPIIKILTDKMHIYDCPAASSPAIHTRTQNQSGFRPFLLFFLLLCSAASIWLIKANARADSDIQEGIARKVLRFHVIANSDSEEDQALKLKVKTALVQELAPRLENLADIDAVRTAVRKQLGDIEKLAEEILRQNGSSYPVSVSLEQCYFPLKIYGGYTFPPGSYEALRVRIGAAEGKNWWCVMFPPLCFVDETYSVVDENSDKKLLSLLTEEEYDALVGNKTPVKIRFKLLDKIKSLFQ